jgi:hypothetical protein
MTHHGAHASTRALAQPIIVPIPAAARDPWPSCWDRQGAAESFGEVLDAIFGLGDTPIAASGSEAGSATPASGPHLKLSRGIARRTQHPYRMRY